MRKKGKNISLDAQAAQLTDEQVRQFWEHVDKRGSDKPDEWAWVGEAHGGKAVFTTIAMVEGVEEHIGFDAATLLFWLLEHGKGPE